jgi:hypothetical protein
MVFPSRHEEHSKGFGVDLRKGSQTTFYREFMVLRLLLSARPLSNTNALSDFT